MLKIVKNSHFRTRRLGTHFIQKSKLAKKGAKTSRYREMKYTEQSFLPIKKSFDKYRFVKMCCLIRTKILHNLQNWLGYENEGPKISK